MPELHTALVSAVSVFFAILFLQSGLDKVFDWKGNLEFHTAHFAKSPLRNVSTGMLVAMTAMEVACGLLSIGGLIYFLVKQHDSTWSYYSCSFASLIFISLFFGQRISKDYAGAAALVPYFILSLLGMYFTFPTV